MSLATYPPAPADRLRALIPIGLARARATGRPVIVSTTEPTEFCDVAAFFAGTRVRGEDACLVERPEDDRALAGKGVAYALSASGTAEAGAAGGAWRDLLADAVIESGDAPEGIGPVLLGGFAFDPSARATPRWAAFPNSLLMLPRLLLTNAAGRSWLTSSVVLRPEDDSYAHSSGFPYRSAPLEPPPPSYAAPGPELRDLPSADVWKAAVARATRAVREGVLEKVALARAVRARAEAPFQPELVLRRLRERYPSCTAFAVARGRSCFLGASPEQLVSLRDGVVRTASLAGSRARGDTPNDDARLGRELFESAKDRREHEVVVRMLSEALQSASGEALAPTSPDLLRVANVQHLYTPITARARPGQGVLDLVAALHPTPAVGGYPREEAMTLIRREEGLDRGWYAAPIGWVDARGEGEFCVAIRSALLRGEEATLYAGCGIVGDSDPEAEWEESRWKLRPMLDALGRVAE